MPRTLGRSWLPLHGVVKLSLRHGPRCGYVEPQSCGKYFAPTQRPLKPAWLESFHDRSLTADHWIQIWGLSNNRETSGRLRTCCKYGIELVEGDNVAQEVIEAARIKICLEVFNQFGRGLGG